ncbi:MAG: cytochrome P450, partial [Candidatus Obscuribacterales bacterium]|nr:cytochrome P450 [Candidatus Obscuribacterales bacterium]
IKNTQWNRIAGTSNFQQIKENGQTGETANNLELLDNGDLRYLDSNGKEKIARQGGTSWELGEPIASSTIEDARSNFNEMMEAQFKNPERIGRLQQLMVKFEQRMADRVECRVIAGEDQGQVTEETEQCIAKTYDNLTEMVAMESQQGSAFQDRSQRATLVEQFIFHAHDTTLMNQGSNGTCWIQAGHILAMLNHPDSMSRLLKEVTLTGSFQTMNNGEQDANPRTIRFSQGLFRRGGNSEEGRWSLNTPFQNGTRSPVGMIFDQVLPVIGGGREWRSNAGSYGGSDGARRIMYMVTGDLVYDTSHKLGGSDQRTFLLKGGMISYAPGHMRTRQLKKIDNQWYVIQDDQHGPRGDRAMYKVRDLRSWLKENPGRVPIHRPLGPGGPGDTINPIYSPDGPGPYDPEYDPGEHRPRIRIFRPIRRIIGRRFF